ncbi:MAG: ABC transporter permease [Bacillota bacterium]
MKIKDVIGVMLIITAGTTLAGFIALPLAALFFKLSVSQLWEGLHSPQVYMAIRTSIVTTSIATSIVIVLGLPLAYLLERHRFWGKEILDTLLNLPLVLPPAVAGVALLMAFGRYGLVGRYLSEWGINISFSTAAVIMAQVFVSAPHFIKQSMYGIAGIDPMLEKASLSLGKSPWVTFIKVTFPLSFPSLLSGAVITWARAMGEFGATMMFAGNLPGRTQTLPLAIYAAMENNFTTAVALSIIMVVFSFVVTLIVKVLGKKGVDTLVTGRRLEKTSGFLANSQI